MIKIALKILAFLINAAIFLTLSVVIFRIVWAYLGLEYVYGKEPIGGDYFNALTYQSYFSQYNPHPAQGWLPFWNEGTPVIGGYPFLSFYLTNFLTHLYDTAVAMNIFSLLSLALFFIFSLLLFRQVTKNWFIALSLTSLLFATRATYNQLTTGGFIVSASAQWYLPLVLFFIYRFSESKNIRYLLLSSLFSGLSLAHHAATSLLMIFTPSFLVLATLPQVASFKKRLGILAVFALISTAVGATGIYSVYLQKFLGTGTDVCASDQCWGIYPKHLEVWLTPVPAILALALILIAATLILFKKQPEFKIILASFLGLSVFFVYAAAAYLKLINGFSNVIPPTRIFWAANFFVLLTAASAAYTIHKIYPKIFFLLAPVISIPIFYFVATHQPDIHKYQPNTVPQDAANYVTGIYRSKNLSDLMPSWLPTGEVNWRLDILNEGVTQWWNAVAQTPQVRGYSNNPLGIHRDWQFFLQSATRASPADNLDEQTTHNQALFLIDAYAIKFFDDSSKPYLQSITKDTQIIVNKDTEVFFLSESGAKITSPKNIQLYQLADDISSPIVSPTNSTPVLFIGNDKGYENFIRTIAMTNLNSRFLIPVKGPSSVKSITKDELKTFPAIVLYQFSGTDLEKLSDYVKSGGNVFIDTASAKFKSGKLPQIIPFESLTARDLAPKDNWQKEDSEEITNTISTDQFSPLSFEEGTWRISAPVNQRSWAKTFIRYQNYPVLAGGKLGKGYVIWGGFNLLFHIVDSQNHQEAKLFRNIVEKLIQPNSPEPDFKVERPKSESIAVQGKNMSGIYFKENYDSGWKAKIAKNPLKVYKAGLEFMYIPVPYTSQNTQVDITYGGNAITWGLYYLTISSLASLAVVIAVPQLPNYIYKKIEAQVKNKVGKKLSKWADEE